MQRKQKRRTGSSRNNRAKINEEPPALPEQTEPVTASQNVAASVENKEVSESKINLSVLEKFKSIKLKKISFDKKDLTKKISALGKNNFVGKVESFFKARLGKKSAQGRRNFRHRTY